MFSVVILCGFLSSHFLFSGNIAQTSFNCIPVGNLFGYFILLEARLYTYINKYIGSSVWLKCLSVQVFSLGIQVRVIVCVGLLIFPPRVGINMSTASALADFFSEVKTSEPESKQAKVEPIKESMGAQNAALFNALTGYLDTKMDKKFDNMEKAITIVAAKTDDGLTEMRRELEKERRERIKANEDLEAKMVAGGTASSAGGGKGVGKGRRTASRYHRTPEELGRTITFSGFPSNTKSTAITDKIKEILGAEVNNTEEQFSFGQRSSKGGARFHQESQMWNYMTTNAGSHTHDFHGTPISVNVYSSLGDEDPKRKAMRKLTRTIIEGNGGNGKEVKAKMESNPGSGEVWYNDEYIAEWNFTTSQMDFQVVGEQYKQAFLAHMRI